MESDGHVRFIEEPEPTLASERRIRTSFKYDALTPYEALVAEGDKKKEILLRRSNANVDKILSDIVKEMLMQKLASIHFESRNTYMLFVPTMAVTVLSAILSIFGTSEVVHSQEHKIYLTICVAVLQLCSSVLYVKRRFCSRHVIFLALLLQSSLVSSYHERFIMFVISFIAASLCQNNSIMVQKLGSINRQPELYKKFIRTRGMLNMNPDTKLCGKH
jgi:hypothetical protein